MEKKLFSLSLNICPEKSLLQKGVGADPWMHGRRNFLKTPIPYCRLYWSLLWGWGSNFVGSESGRTTEQFSTSHPHPPPPQSHIVCIYTEHLVCEGGGGKVKEKVEGQQYTDSSFVHGGSSSQAGSTIPTMNECISSL